MLRTSSICLSFMYNYMTQNSSDNFDKKTQNIQCLTKTLAKYGGVLTKVSQILSLENDDNNEVFSNCTPYLRKKTDEYIKELYNKNDNVLSEIDINLDEIYRSGSIGQVYKGVYNDENVIVKVQYVGLPEQYTKDLNILDKIVSYLYGKSKLETALEDVAEKLYEELDYNIEKENQKLMYHYFKDDEDIIIPKILDKFSSKNIIVMEDMTDYVSVYEFIENSTQEQRNFIGELLVKFVFTSLYKHNILYSDCHYGNFLVKRDGTKLCVLDFGSIHYIDDDLLENIKSLHRVIKLDDKAGILEHLTTMTILDESVSQESRDYAYDFFTIQYEPLVTNDEFEFYTEWLDLCVSKNIALMKEWYCPRHLIHFHKISFGLYHVLTKLELCSNVCEIIDTILN